MASSAKQEMLPLKVDASVINEPVSREALRGRRPESEPGSGGGIAHENHEGEGRPKQCQYVQIPSEVKQDTRLIAAFVVRADTGTRTDDTPATTTLPPPSFWRPADERENPIWGWVAMNFANIGLQLFLPDGTFHREVRMASKAGSQSPPQWLPSRSPPKDDPRHKSPDMLQLELLAQRLGDESFALAFCDMIVRATDSMKPAPDAHASFANGLVGRPFALVNTGYSLELVAEPRASQLGKDNAIPRTLLKEDDKTQYTWGLKLGDNQRSVEGLVGYFETYNQPNADKTEDLGLMLETMFTDFGPPSTQPNGTTRLPVAPAELLELHAFYENPTDHPIDADEHSRRRNAQLVVFGMLVDPFSPIRAYSVSGSLPAQELTLPPWTWQGAMNKMKTFFHTGPLVIVHEVPEFDAGLTRELDAHVAPVEAKHEFGSVAKPNMASGDGAWLQPYDDEPKEASSGRDEEGDRSADMVLPLSGFDGHAQFEPASFTALEGYLTLARPGEEERRRA